MKITSNRIISAVGLLLFSTAFALMPVSQTLALGGVCDSPAFINLGIAGCHGYFTSNGTKDFNRPAPYGVVGYNIVDCNYSSLLCVNGTGPNNAIPFAPAVCTAVQLPCGVKNAADFEKWMGWYLQSGYSYNHAGAAYIVDAMLGRQGTGFANVNAGINYALAHFQEWKNDVTYYDSQGWIDWYVVTPVFAGQINSMHACNTTYSPAGSCQENTVGVKAANGTYPYDGKDEVIFRQQTDEPSHLIIFHNPNGTSFEIRRECANLVASDSPLVPPPPPVVNPACGAMMVNPGKVDPDRSFLVQVTVTYKTTGEANAVMGSTNQMKLSVSGPGVSYSDNNILMNQDGADINATSTTLGPSNNTGIYTVNWGVTGSAIPSADINCNATFFIANMPYFEVNGGDVSAGGAMDIN